MALVAAPEELPDVTAPARTSKVQPVQIGSTTARADRASTVEPASIKSVRTCVIVPDYMKELVVRSDTVIASAVRQGLCAWKKSLVVVQLL